MQRIRRAVQGVASERRPPRVRVKVFELHALSTIHAVAWVVLLFRKFRCGSGDFSKYCSRALVASLGYYLHDLWAPLSLQGQSRTTGRVAGARVRSDAASGFGAKQWAESHQLLR